MFGRLVVALALVSTFGVSTASAHFRLLKPTSWLEEDNLGDPQKTGPCGNSGTQTNEVTTFQAGETITVEWAETIPHPGHFRIALVRDRSELEDPDIDVDSSCNYVDPTAVANRTAVPPVLLENLYPRDSDEVMFGMTFTQEVTLPDMECEKCTLQVIQFMTEHAQPCIYYHCADIKIVGGGGASGAGASGSGGASGASGGAGGMGAATAGTGASSGTGGAASNPMMTAGTGAAGTAGTTIGGIGAAGSTAGAGGSAAAPTGGANGAAGMSPAPTSSSDSGGCSVARDASVAPTISAFALALVALLLRRRRAR
jgi:MYXO-CTERM domain-containing protein